MTPMAQPTGLLTELRRRVLVRTVLRATAVAFIGVLGLAVLLALISAFTPRAAGVRSGLGWLALAPLAWIPWAFARARTSATETRLALLADERGGRGNLATTVLTTNASGPIAEAFRSRAAEELRAIDPREVVPFDAGRLWSGVLVAALIAVPAVFALESLPGALVVGEAAEGRGAAGSVERSSDPGALPSLGNVRVTVRPPAYSGLPDSEAAAGGTVVALPGSVVEIVGTGTARAPGLRARVVGGDPVDPVAHAEGWSVTWTVGPDDRGLAIDATQAGEVVERRVVPLQLLRDRPPTVVLDEPSRDLVLASATGEIRIRARAGDDFGVSDLELHWVRSRGSGESFDFEEGTWPWDVIAPDAKGRQASRLLRLEELGLQPGDVLHVRGVARDANDVTGPGVGVSQTRQIRISREDDLSDVTTIIGFPIEREREPLLSQRMIILLTEELLERAARLQEATLLDEAAEVADEQARLRSRIGEQIFSRATGAMQDPEAHLEFEDGEAEVFLDELENAAEAGPVIDPETGIASIADVDIIAHDHDSDPIVAINRSLLTIYNYMWDAERMLREASLDPSLLPQNLALDELQAIRESERIFVRGRVAVRPIDVPAARGTGEVDDADPSTRGRAVGATDGESVAAEIERLLGALPVETGRVAAVRISGLALDVLESGGDADAAAALSLAAERAGSEDRDDTVVALRDALRRLRASDLRSVPDALGGPSSYAAARYLAAGRDDAPVGTSTDGSADDAAPFVFATVQYASGDWDSAPLVPTNLIHALAQYTELPVAPEGVIVDLSSPEIFDYPFLYLTGHLPVFFGDAEGRNLVEYVERGGFVFIDDHNHDIDGAFHRSVTTELERLFGGDALQELPNDHELYSSFFVFDEGPPITGHELSGWGDGLIHRNLQHVEADGRIGVLYSNKDYSSEWSYHAENKRFLAVDNTRFGVNILVYALTR